MLYRDLRRRFKTAFVMFSSSELCMDTDGAPLFWKSCERQMIGIMTKGIQLYLIISLLWKGCKIDYGSLSAVLRNEWMKKMFEKIKCHLVPLHKNFLFRKLWNEAKLSQVYCFCSSLQCNHIVQISCITFCSVIY